MPEQTTVVKCQRCEKVLGQPAGTPVAERTPCPDCGSTARHVEQGVHATSTGRAGMRAKARSGEPGQPGSKPWLETRTEPSWWRDGKKWVERTKTEDRRNDWYSEVIKDPDTGEIIYQDAEPLTDHRGHGSAKRKKDEKDA